MGGNIHGITHQMLMDYTDLSDKIPFIWFIMKNQTIAPHSDIYINKSFTAKAIQARVAFAPGLSASNTFNTLVGRSDADGSTIDIGNNDYALVIRTAAVTADFVITKDVSGTPTVIATEAVDITADKFYAALLNCNGTTIAGYRGANSYNNDVQGSSSMSATDSAHSSGKFGMSGITRFWINSAATLAYQAVLVQGAYLKGAL